jgi:hypothetical protein
MNTINCKQCGKETELTSTQPVKTYCSRQCYFLGVKKDGGTGKKLSDRFEEGRKAGAEEYKQFILNVLDYMDRRDMNMGKLASDDTREEIRMEIKNRKI